jgi:RNA polymerase primary sigma factor
MNMAELSDRLVEVLNQKGWSQAQLAHELEVSSAAVSGWCSGSKRPTPTNLAAIATRLGVSPSYLQYGDGVAPSMDLGEARRAYRSELEWYWRPAPQDGGRELGNPAGFAFKIDMPTLARESAQNALDERRPGEPTVVMDYTVIELSGAMLDDFLEAIQFNDAVRPHLKAAATTHQKVSAVIANGLRRLDEEGRLVMIRITDNFANGLLGPEYDTGRHRSSAWSL